MLSLMAMGNFLLFHNILLLQNSWLFLIENSQHTRVVFIESELRILNAEKGEVTGFSIHLDTEETHNYKDIL